MGTRSNFFLHLNILRKFETFTVIWQNTSTIKLTPHLKLELINASPTCQRLLEDRWENEITGLPVDFIMISRIQVQHEQSLGRQGDDMIIQDGLQGQTPARH